MKDWHTLAAAAGIFIVAAVIIMCVLALSGAFGENETEPAAKPESSIPISESSKIQMRLGAFEGKLALFKGESRYPNEIFDVLLRSLPEADRLRLEEGIKVYDEEELKRLIEDFTS